MWIAFGLGTLIGSAIGLLVFGLLYSAHMCDLEEANELLMEEIMRLRERTKIHVD